MDGAAYCWGDGDLSPGGRLGDGTSLDRHVATAVGGGHTFASIFLGLSSTCALTPDGDAYRWGQGYFGDGTASHTALPVIVAGWEGTP